MAKLTVSEYRITDATSKTGMTYEEAEFLARQAEEWYQDSGHRHPADLFDVWVGQYEYKETSVTACN